MASTRLLTADELWLMDDDEQRYELVNGELVRIPPAGGEHGEIRFSLTALIGSYLVQNKIGKSPSDSSAEVNDKIMQYLDLGVTMVWLVHPSSKSINVYTPDRRALILTEDDDLIGGDVLPGFKVRVDDIFD